MNDRRRRQISLRTWLIATALVPPHLWVIYWWSPSATELPIGLIAGALTFGCFMHLVRE